jgi:P27 family predicted phage terminase small subunit
MPDFLSEVAQDEWKRMVPILLNMRVLTIADGSALAGYCSAYAQFRWAEEYIARNGAMVEEPILNRQQEVVGAKLKKNPAVAMKNESAKIMRQFLGDFGLSPAMRSKVQTMAPGNDGKDELDKLLEDDDPVSTKTLTQ